MNKLLELIDSLDARLAAINTEQAGIEAAALSATGGILSVDQRTKHEALSAEYEAKLAELNTAKADYKRQNDRQSRKPTEPMARPKTEPEIIRIGNPKLAAEADPCKGFKSPREFMSAVIEAGQGYHAPDERLSMLTVGSDEARGNSDPAGGFLIPEGFSPNLLKIMPEADPMGGLTTQIPMATPTLKMPARVDTTHTTSVTGGLTVTRRPETVAGTPSQMTLSGVQLVAHSLFGLSYATEEILSDSPISFAALLTTGFSEQFTSHLIGERITGTGIGEFQGVLTAACLVSVAKETGQAAATITKENIDKMRSRCWGYGKAVWLYNHDCLPQLRSLVQSVGTGGVPVGYFSVDANGNATLDGRPAIATEYCKTLGTAGDLILGNWSEYLEGLYQPMQSAESIHVRFVNHERAFKFWLRNAGQPWWKAALTPKNSTATLSPFVVLDSRA